jgi:hypothetical protein
LSFTPPKDRPWWPVPLELIMAWETAYWHLFRQQYDEPPGTCFCGWDRPDHPEET